MVEHQSDTATADSPTGQGIPKSRFRPDIEGLRAIAVGLVVLFHAGFPWLPGGYVGVDVFFVISGFLITGLLLREVQKTNRLSIKNFYVRRIRRILPMSTLVLAVTVICAALWMTGTESTAAATAASWAALFAANWYFASSASDYFDTSTQTNPILHYWSLGVEEQFYVIWPLLLVAAILIARWRGASTKSLLRGALVGLVILCVVSLWWSATKTTQEGQWAFFGLHTRLWELGAGGLLAYSIPRLGRMPRLVSTVLSVLGILLVGFAAVTFTEATVFPGVAAILPVLGTALVIAAGSSHQAAAVNPTVVGRLLAIKPMQYLGARSYNLYLWHWPILVFAAMWSSPKTFGGSDSSHLTMPALVAVAAVAVAFGFTIVTFRLIEQPLRNAKILKHPRTAFPVALGMILVVLLVSLFGSPAIVSAKESRLDSGRKELVAQAEKISGELKTNAFWHRRLPCLESSNGGKGQPLSSWSKDDCIFGDLNGKKRVALIGDSHADMWLPALDKIGVNRGIQITYIAKSFCPIYAVSPTTQLERLLESCRPWTKAAMEELQEQGPFDAVIVGRRAIDLTRRMDAGGPNKIQKLSPDQSLTADIRYTYRQLASVTDRIIILSDSATPDFDIPACIERNQGDATACEFDRAEGIKEELRIQQDERQAAIGLPGRVTVEIVDTASLLCPEELTSCPATIERANKSFILFRDTQHIPYATSSALADDLDRLLAQQLK